MRAIEFFTFTPGGAPYGVAIDLGAKPPVQAAMGQGWWVVVANPTPLYLQVFGPNGGKWVPPYVADVFGSYCDALVPLYIIWIDFAGGAPTSTITLSWATEPDDYGPGAAIYPGALG